MSRPSSLRDVESHDDSVSECQSWATLLACCAIGYFCMLLVIVSFCLPLPSLLELGLFALVAQKGSPPPFYAFPQGSGYFEKPKDFKIVALVPFHNYERTAILDCYLQRNLITNHGFLDHVTFIPRTNDTDSLEWLTGIVEETASYSISHTSEGLELENVNKDVMYIWIDGDIVFLEDHTIPTIVKTKLTHSDSLIISANVANEAALATLHNYPGVALPYLPELSRAPQSQSSQSKSKFDRDWRASNLPRWYGPDNFRVLKGFSPPSYKHRWLLSDEMEIDRTPISATMYTNDGPGLDHWTVSAQQHYSFLHHLEQRDLHRYKFPLWVNPADSVSESFLCFWGDDASAVQSSIWRNEPGESELEVKGRRHIIIDGKGLAAHYSANADAEGLNSTDILQRYQAYAQEMVCLDTF